MGVNETKQEIILRYRRGIILLAHVAIVVVAYSLSFLLRFDFSIPLSELPGFFNAFFLIIPVKLLVFAYFGLYRGLWMYSSIYDLMKILKANVSATAFFIISVALWGGQGFPRSIFIVDFVLCTGLVGGIRFISIFIKENYYRGYKDGIRRILIVGAGEAGLMLLREYRKNPSLGWIVGFIDDDKIKIDESIQGIRILGGRRDIPRVVEESEVDEIILAIPSAQGEVVRDILSYCEQTPAKIKVVPGFSKILSGEMEVRARDVKPEDLLGRETVRINEDEIRNYVGGKVVLVTGAGGSIGSEICRQIVRFNPKEIILFDHHENFVYFLTIEFKVRYPSVSIKTCIGDIRDVGLLKRLFTKETPEVIFHAAAHKHVPLMEENPIAAVKNNVLGSRNMIYAAHHYGVERFVLISTDKAVNPINVMGMSKRVAEMILQAKAKVSKTKFMAVRFGNVLGSAGSVVPLFKKQIADGGPITITHPDVKRYFMSITEAVMLVLQAGSMGKCGELFILDMGEQIKVIEIARNLIALSGLTIDKDISIKFIGLRPGEKLEEELLLDKEKDAATKHDKIFISQPQEFDLENLGRGIKRLHRLVAVMDVEGVMEEMKAIIAGNYTDQDG
ncbi:MAG: polysaccharide biosynthesis protein [Candidatus Omnitrophica bacterium]|nr:polysaccharide biosynthesis protein [Candidatus Omnitrophota bacterium]